MIIKDERILRWSLRRLRDKDGGDPQIGNDLDRV